MLYVKSCSCSRILFMRQGIEIAGNLSFDSDLLIFNNTTIIKTQILIYSNHHPLLLTLWNKIITPNHFSDNITHDE